MVSEMEWLEADGLGGFASGTVGGVRTRRYHALLLTATTPPTGRMVLVNGVEVWAETPSGTFALSTLEYEPGVRYPDGTASVESFEGQPWPSWIYALRDGTRIRHEVLVQRDTGLVLLVWTLLAGPSATIRIRPLLSGRDYHSTHHENGAFRFDPEVRGSALRWRPYDGVPAVCVLSNGTYSHAPQWYRQFLYANERERGLDALEDLASPGTLTFVLTASRSRAVLCLSAGDDHLRGLASADAEALATGLMASEGKRRAAFVDPLVRAADAYLVRRGSGQTIVAGYPWFTDWGRDTFIAIRGLCIASGRLADARDILLEWAGAVSEGMLPNRFPDAGESAEFNAVDASLWFIVAVHDLLVASKRRRVVSSEQQARLESAVGSILDGYMRGTRFGIRMDEDGLLAAGVPGVQLTWMDARVGDRVITPRIGKPVEVQALWINALWTAARLDASRHTLVERSRAAFLAKFWNPDRNCLFDVIDVDHVPGRMDGTLRPNQILAVGGLPLSILDGPRARAVVDLVERELLTPAGLRSLARSEAGYAPQYSGTPADRDSVYHQGTVWPWLIGPFVEAWLNVREPSNSIHGEALERFIDPLIARLDPQRVGHICEIADAEEPFTPRGCPFQAWSLGEVLRVRARITGGARPRIRRDTRLDARAQGVPATTSPSS